MWINNRSASCQAYLFSPLFFFGTFSIQNFHIFLIINPKIFSLQLVFHIFHKLKDSSFFHELSFSSKGTLICFIWSYPRKHIKSACNIQFPIPPFPVGVHFLLCPLRPPYQQILQFPALHLGLVLLHHCPLEKKRRCSCR